MSVLNSIFMWITALAPFIASTVAFVRGALKFFQKGTALYLQIVTLAMGCYALSNLYELCQTLAFDGSPDGFTAAYLGRIGFFLFLLTANFGQMDGLLDDGSAKMRPARLIGMVAPVVAMLLYVLVVFSPLPQSTKIVYAIVWLPALASLYFNLKHAVIPDLGLDFASAVRPYNVTALALSMLELLLLCVRAYDGGILLSLVSAILSLTFGGLCLICLPSLEKGVKKWIT